MPMRKPAYVALFVFSGLLAACAKAEFARLQPAATGGTPGGTGGVVVPPEDADPLECETGAVCLSSATGDVVPCPAVRCHTATTGQRPGRDEVCVDPAKDNCAPGNICLNFGDKVSYCFQLCSASTDCDSVACAGRTLNSSTMVQVCDRRPTSCSTGNCCDPLTNNLCAALQTCYLVPPLSAESQDSRTVCEAETGDKGTGVRCTSSRECYAGWACYVAPQNLPGGAGACQKVCNAANPCARCTPYNNSQWGVCL
jgi:hypothetical protein